MSPLPPAAYTAAARLAAPLFPRYLWRRDDEAVALTFDDGPDPEGTPPLLDLLAEHGVRATFFLLGVKARRHPALVRAIRGGGHTIGQHTDSHPDPWRTPPRRLAAEMEAATRTLEDAAGEPVRWMRPPYGHVTPPLRRWAEARGQRVALWDVMPGDFLPSATTEGVSRALTRWTRPGSVVVLHEGGRAARVTPPALSLALPPLRAAGLRFTPL